MAESRPLAVLVFDVTGTLLRCSREAVELGGRPVDEGEALATWCRRMFPDPLTPRIVEEVFEMMLENEAAHSDAFEFSARFRGAGGETKGGYFTLMSLRELPGFPGPQFMVSFFEKPDDLHSQGPLTEGNALDPALGRIGDAGRELLSLVEGIQTKIIASALQAREGRPGEPEAWDELLREAYVLEKIRGLVGSISDSTGIAQNAALALVPVVDPDQPPTEASMGRPVTLPLGISLQKLERFWILSTLQALHGNRTRCARHLGIALRTVRYKLEEYRTDGFRVPSATRQGRIGAGPVLARGACLPAKAAKGPGGGAGVEI